MCAAQSAGAAGRQAKREAKQLALKPKFKWIARAGYIARGVIYMIVGALAILAAVGQGGQTTGSQGALRSLADETYGQAMLILLAIGLFGYCIWRAIQSVADADNHGTDAKGIAVRVGLGISAATHGFLAVYALSIAFGWGFGSGGGGGGNDGASGWSAWLLRQPGGQWLLAAVGLAVVGAGMAQVLKGWKEKYRRYLAMNWQEVPWGNPVCKLGLIARGVVFVIIGIFILVAALQADPQEARGLGRTLQTIQGQAYGTILLLIVAVGLVAFGIYSLIEARYRRIG